YGGALPHRLRFGIRVLEAIRARCGDDFIIGLRITGDDFTKGGLDNETMRQIAGQLDALGLLDYFSVIGSTAETFVAPAAAVPDMAAPHATYANLAASIKGVVRVPVIAAGRITHPSEAGRGIAGGQAGPRNMARGPVPGA